MSICATRPRPPPPPPPPPPLAPLERPVVLLLAVVTDDMFAAACSITCDSIRHEFSMGASQAQMSPHNNKRFCTPLPHTVLIVTHLQHVQSMAHSDVGGVELGRQQSSQLPRGAVHQQHERSRALRLCAYTCRACRNGRWTHKQQTAWFVDNLTTTSTHAGGQASTRTTALTRHHTAVVACNAPRRLVVRVGWRFACQPTSNVGSPKRLFT